MPDAGGNRWNLPGVRMSTGQTMFWRSFAFLGLEGTVRPTTLTRSLVAVGATIALGACFDLNSAIRGWQG